MNPTGDGLSRTDYSKPSTPGTTPRQSVRNPESWRDPWITNQEMYNIIIGKQNSDIFARSTFKGAIYRPAYRLNVGWVIADIMSNTVLLAAAIVSFWLRKHTLAPDIFGYVSSLTRDNPNVPLPEGGTALSGWDRARLLRDVRVRIAASTDTGVGWRRAGGFSAGRCRAGGDEAAREAYALCLRFREGRRRILQHLI